MDVDVISKSFERIGARVRIVPISRRWNRSIEIDIARDRHGEYFDLSIAEDAGLRAVDVRPKLRHLLLMLDPPRTGSDRRAKYLCGHDERHWFVAGVPLNRGVSNVVTAMEALKPPAVRDVQAQRGVSGEDRLKRRNRAFRRQGEWFFIPRGNITVDPRQVLSNEPMVRTGGGKPHWVDKLVRTGGETVYVSKVRPDGVTQEEYRDLLARQPELRSESWRVMRRNPSVLVTGRVRHPDHATITLDGWHQVLMNEEHKAPGRESIAFLD